MWPKSHRRGFTLVELLVVVAIIGMLIALLLPAVQAAREAGRRSSCSNNLRQLAMGCLLYEDTTKQLPPLCGNQYYYQPGGFSWIAFVLPFMEQGNVEAQFDYSIPANTGINLTTVSQFRWGTLLCPTRRSSGVSTAGWGGYPTYQPTDYAAVLCGASADYYSPQSDALLRFPTQIMTATSPVKSATTLASAQGDGLSNTAMIGEKSLHPSMVNGPQEAPALAFYWQHWYSGRILGGNYSTPEADGLFWTGYKIGLIRNPSHDYPAGSYTYPEPYGGNTRGTDGWWFGSWHPQVCLFARGDASVATVNSSTGTGILSAFGGCRDSQTFSLQ